MGTEKSYEVGRGRPPKASRWKEGQSGNSKGKTRRPLSEAELILRYFRRQSWVSEDGKKVLKSNFAIIYSHLLVLESKGNRAAGRARDRYEKFADVNRPSTSFFLRHAQNDFTREFADELRRQRAETQATAEAELPETSTS